MPKQELLPGVITTACPPQRVVSNAQREIRRAKRRALVRDGIQLVLVAAVDVLFIWWPEARVPLFDRAQTTLLLTGVNLLMIGEVWLSRALPRWSARRISSTWCRNERNRFDETEQRLRTRSARGR